MENEDEDSAEAQARRFREFRKITDPQERERVYRAIDAYELKHDPLGRKHSKALHRLNLKQLGLSASLASPRTHLGILGRIRRIFQGGRNRACGR